MYKLLRQLFSFISVSGIGWLIDFSIYLVLTACFGFDVFIANFLSAIPAITFVFLVSTRYVFGMHLKGIDKVIRYLSYFLYQMILLYLVSTLSQALYNYEPIWFISDISFTLKKIIVKLCITPITMFVNFMVLKVILETLRKEKDK